MDSRSSTFRIRNPPLAWCREPALIRVKSVYSAPISASRSMEPSRLNGVGWSSTTTGAPLVLPLSTNRLTSNRVKKSSPDGMPSGSSPAKEVSRGMNWSTLSTTSSTKSSK